MKQLFKNLYHFFSPDRQTLSLEYKTEFKPRYGHGKPAHSILLEIIEKERGAYKDLLNGFLDHTQELQKIKECKDEDNDLLPCWNNGYLPGLDIIALYSLSVKYNPSRYIEVGSGNSTKVVRKAISDHGLQTRILSIDPEPRSEIKGIADEIINQRLEDTDLEKVLCLEAGDILFIDNSHRVLPNSDAMVVFLEILPYLRKGVLVHIHDIYLPYDYPQFMCDRFYSEQYVLGAMIISNPQRYRTLLPNYFISEDKLLSGLISSIWDHENLKNVERHGGSYWITIA